MPGGSWREPVRQRTGLLLTPGRPAVGSAHMGSMELIPLITLILATVIVTVLLSWFFGGRRQALSPTHGALAPAWREGYLQGVQDEQYADAINFCHDGYGRVGPNRANPYRGSEKTGDE